MKFTNILPSLAVCTIFFGIASQNNCSAVPDTIIGSLGSPGGATTNVNVSATFGYSFTLGGSDATLTSLGIWAPDDSGLTESHTVGLWSSTGTLLASTTIPVGTSATFANNFWYETVTPVSLSAGITYVLGVYDDSANTDAITFGQTSTLGDDIASIGSPLYDNGSSLTFPTSAVGLNADGFFGPNAALTVGSVPEPGTLALVGAGSLVSWLLVRRRKS
jgi:hypothetical protein